MKRKLRFKVGDNVVALVYSKLVNSILVNSISVRATITAVGESCELHPYQISFTDASNTTHIGWVKEEEVLSLITDETDETSDNYRNGLKEGQKQAWDLAGRIIRCPISSVFNSASVRNVFDNYTYEEAFEKFQEYEKNIIKVGDEVTWNNDKGVVTAITYDNIYHVLCSDGTMQLCNSSSGLTKTGRRIYISEVFKQMED